MGQHEKLVMRSNSARVGPVGVEPTAVLPEVTWRPAHRILRRAQSLPAPHAAIAAHAAALPSQRPVAAAPSPLAGLMHPDLAQALGPQDPRQHASAPNQIERALPYVAQLRLIDGHQTADAIVRACEALYGQNFSADEAESPDCTRARRQDMDSLYGAGADVSKSSPAYIQLQARYRGSRFFHLAALDGANRVVAQSQFTALPVGRDGIAVYSQYIMVASAADMSALYGPGHKTMRGRGLLSLLKCVELALAAGHGKRIGQPNLLGVLLESEMRGQAADARGIRFTHERLVIHHHFGGHVMLLKMGDGTRISPHIQPSLSPGQARIRLHLLVAFVDDLKAQGQHDLALAQTIMQAYLGNFLCEGFDPEEVAQVLSDVDAAFNRANEVMYLAPDTLPDITQLARDDAALKAQVEATYGGLDAHRERVDAALSIG